MFYWLPRAWRGKADGDAAAEGAADDGHHSLTDIAAVSLLTGNGTIRIRLHPEWPGASGSVHFVRRIAAESLCTTCEFYRAEPGFLLQGTLRPSKPPYRAAAGGGDVAASVQRGVVRGEVGWAGGGTGPDWVIYLGDKPADWRRSTLWGEVADHSSLAVAEAAVSKPRLDTPPGEVMHFLRQRIPFSLLPGLVN